MLGDLLPREVTDPEEWLEDLNGPPDLVAVLTATVPPRSDRYAVVHADLGAEHLLAVGEDLTGVVDWSDAAVTDPAVDFARLYRDFGREFLRSVVDAYGGLEDVDRTLQRVQYYARCAALEDLEYGRTSGRSLYADAAKASVRRLFEVSELHLSGWRPGRSHGRGTAPRAGRRRVRWRISSWDRACAGLRASVRGDGVRVAFHLYNTARDVDRVLDALHG